MLFQKHQVYVLSAAAVAGSLLYFFTDPSRSVYFPPCPFLMLTGLYCPGCGSQRAFHALLHGDIPGAAGFNFLFILFLPLVILSGLLTIRQIFTGKTSIIRLLQYRQTPVVVLTIVLLFWLLRNIPVVPFDLLAP